MVLDKGDDVRKSKRITERSVAHAAIIEVSTGLKESVLIV